MTAFRRGTFYPQICESMALLVLSLTERIRRILKTCLDWPELMLT